MNENNIDCFLLLHIFYGKIDHNLLKMEIDVRQSTLLVGDMVASWLVRSTPEQAVWVRALAGDSCAVFLGRTLYSPSASLHPGV